MKKFLLSVSLLGGLLVGCSSDDNANSKIDDDGVEVIGGVTQPNEVIKFIDSAEGKRVGIDYDEDIHEKGNSKLHYNSDGKLVSVLGDKGEVLVNIEYSNGDLTSVNVEEGDSFNILDVIAKQPFEFKNRVRINSFENGNVTSYTSYGFDDDNILVEDEEVTIEYDSKPFFAFHTLNSTGAIDISKKTSVDIGAINGGTLTGENTMNKFVPANNPKKMKYVDLTNPNNFMELNIEYTYDVDNYVTGGTFSQIGEGEEYDYRVGKDIKVKTEITGSFTITYKK